MLPFSWHWSYLAYLNRLHLSSREKFLVCIKWEFPFMVYSQGVYTFYVYVNSLFRIKTPHYTSFIWDSIMAFKYYLLWPWINKNCTLHCNSVSTWSYTYVHMQNTHLRKYYLTYDLHPDFGIVFFFFLSTICDPLNWFRS